MEVRPADIDDIEGLARLRARWREEPSSAEFLSTFRDWFLHERDSRRCWIAVDGPETVGMVNLKIFDRMPAPGRLTSRWGYLANLFVVEDRRGAGVGSRLVAAAVDFARSEGLVRLVLSPSERSIPLYGRHGFRPANDLLILPLETD